MSLTQWIKEASALLSSPPERLRRRNRHGRTALRQQRRLSHPLRQTTDTLEQRVMPATLAWSGDVNQHWQGSAGENTNWSATVGGDTLPASGDSLVFGDTEGSRVLVNDSATESVYQLIFTADGYQVSGESIVLSHPDVDLQSSVGSTVLGMPLTLVSTTSIDIADGTTELQGSLTGTGAFTKTGDGDLILSGGGNFSGDTIVNEGTLQISSTFSGPSSLFIATEATLSGSGSWAGTVSAFGEVAPGQTTGTLSTGAITLAASSTLRIHLTGAANGQYDVLQSSGAVSLDGTLALTTDPDFSPAAGQIFEIVTGTSVTGNFHTLSGLSYNGGMLLPVRTPNSLLLIATPLPTGLISFSVNSVQMGTDLATFFSSGTGSLAISGSMHVAGQTLTGSFALSRQSDSAGTPRIVVAATQVGLSLHGQSENLFSLSNGSGIVVLTESGFASTVQATLSDFLPGITLSTSAELTINTLAEAVDETVTIDGQSVTLQLPAGPYVRVATTDTVLATDVIDVHGSFTLETTGSGANREILLGASGVTAFLGDEAGTPLDASDDTGVRLTDGELLAVVTSAGTMALSATGDIELQGVSALTLTGLGALEINSIGQPIVRSITVGGVSGTLDLQADLERVALRNVVAAFPGFVEFTGNFAIERVVDGETTTLRAAAADVGAFLGINAGQPDELGVRLSNAGAAILIEKTAGVPVKIAAGSVGGTLELQGLPDLTLAGSLSLQVNFLDKPIETSITPLSGPAIPLVFETEDAVRRFGGSLTLGVAGFTELTGNFGFEKDSASAPARLKLAATGVSAFLGTDGGTADPVDDVGVRLTDARFGGVVYKVTDANTYAFDALGTAELVNVTGLTLDGSLAARINTTGGAVNESISVPGGAPVQVVFDAEESAPVFSGTVTASAGDFASLSGAFSISKANDQLKVAAANVDAFIGAGTTGLEVTDASLGMVVNTASRKFALVADGSAALVGVPGFSLSGSGTVRINQLDATVDETISTPDGDVRVLFESADDVLQVAGNVSITIADFISGSAAIVLEKTTSGDLTTLLVQASEVTAFLGAGASTASTSDDMGVQLTDGTLDLRINRHSGNNTTTYAFAAHGTAEVVGIDAITLSGNLVALRNTGDASVTLDFGTSDTDDDVTIGPGITRFGGSVEMSIAGFAMLTGNFGFERETAGDLTKLKIAASDVNAFLGNNPDGELDTADDVGARISNAQLGAVFYRTAAGQNTYAIDASGAAALVGVPTLTLEGSLSARVNTTGGAVEESIEIPGHDPVNVTFGEEEDEAVFSGTVTASAGDFASLSGAFSISKANDQLKVAAANVEAFIGAGTTGLKVTDANLGLVVNTASRKFALVADGSAALVGVPGFSLSGSGTVRINQLDATVDETISTPDGDVRVLFDSADDVLQVAGNVSITIADFISGSAAIVVEKTTSGDLTTLLVQASEVTAFLGAGASTASTSDDMGVQLTDGTLDLRINRHSGNNTTTYAFAAHGTAEVVGIDAITLSGNLVALRNTGDASVTLDFGTSDTDDDVTIGPGITRFGGSVEMSIAGFAMLTGNFGFERETAGDLTKLKIAASDVNAFLGNNPDGELDTADDVGARISNAQLGAVFYRTAAGQNTYAIDASGAAALVGVPTLTLEGSLSARVNTTGGAVEESIEIPGHDPVNVTFGEEEDEAVFSGSVTISAADFATLEGAFSIAKSPDRLKIGAAGIQGFVGADDTGVRLSDAWLGLVVNTSSKKFALHAGGSVSLEGIDDFSISGNGAIQINRLGTGVDETISTPAGDVTVFFPDGAEAMRVTGTVSMTISDFVDASATITVEKDTTDDQTVLAVQASNVTAFLGVGADTSSTSDDMGIRLSDGALDLRWTKNTATDTSYYALGARGTASLVGISGLTLSGSLQAERNTGPNPVHLGFGTASTDDDLQLEPNAKRFGGSVRLGISGFIDISGAFGFEETTITVNGVSVSRIKVAAAGITTFLGTGEGTANETGFRLSNGQIGAIIDRPAGGSARYALVAQGTVSLVGIPGLTASGTMHARVNRLGSEIDTSISTPAGPVQVKFDSADDVTQFGGTAHLAIGGFVDISGSFGIEKSGTEVLVGVTDVSVFLGVNGGTPNAIGVQVSEGTLGLVLRNGKYALSTSGQVALVGLPGLSISGTFNVEANKLGTSINRSIWTPTGSAVVYFPNGSEILRVGGSAVISVAGVFEVSGEIQATKTKSGRIFIDIPEVAVALNIGGLQVFRVGGKARFSLGGPEGFKLLDIGLTEINVMGVDILAIERDLPSLALPPDIPVPAELATIVDGVDAALLNTRKYLDVTFQPPGVAALDISSVLDAAAEFNLSGQGVADALLDRVEHLDGNTFRYYLRDRDTTNEIPLFRPGSITVSFQPNTWRDANGTGNTGATDTFTARDGSASTTREVELGPLKLSKPYFGIEDFEFRPLKNASGGIEGARITIEVGIGVGSASLALGEESSTFSTKIEGLLGIFAVNIDMGLDLQIRGGSPGRFNISADTFELTVTDVLKVNAAGISIGWDPEKDKDGDGQVSASELQQYRSQEILSLDSASVELSKIDLRGDLRPYRTRSGQTIPGLVVRANGFHLGEASLTYTNSVSFGGILDLTNPEGGIADFGATFGSGGGVDFNGEIFVAAKEAELFPGKTFSMSFKDGPDEGTQGVRAALTFKDGIPAGFKFNTDKMSMKFGEFVTVTGQDILVNTEAKGSEYIVSIGSVGAEIKAGPLKIGGKMKKFGITGDGKFVTQPGFGVELSMDEASPDSFKWPKWLPIRLTSLGIEWKDIESDPADFALVMDAKISKIPGVPLDFTGAVTGLRVDVGLLKQGKFPVTDLESISVKVGGDFGGAEVSGTLLGGILRIDDNGNMIESFDRDTPVADRVLFIGLEGKLLILDQGFQVRFAFSELGPLGVLISVQAPVVVEPVFTGLTINEFTGGVEFFQSLPTITKPEELENKAFAPAGELDADQWLIQVKKQVVNQVKALKNNPGISGFLAAFTSPMTITASATISSTHLGSEDSFNGDVELRLSTDGKFFASGRFRFMDNRLVIDGKMYADFSQILKGNAKVLFLGKAPVIEDAPDLRFLVLKGKFEMRFFGANGEPMDFSESTSETPTSNLASPASGSVIGLKKLTDQGYIDVSFLKGAKPLDLDSITDAESEFLLELPDGTVIEITSTPQAVTDASEDNVYRYQLPADLILVPGEYKVTFHQGGFLTTESKENTEETETFTVAMAEAILATPRDGAQIDVLTLNAGGFLTMQFIPLPGAELAPSSITDAAAEFVLSGAAAAGVVLGSPQKVDDVTWKWPFSGQFAPGSVTVLFPAGAFLDLDDNPSDETTATFTVTGPVINPLSSSADVGALNSQGYVDFWVEGTRDGSIVPDSLTDEAAEFTIYGAGAGTVLFSGTATRQTDNVYRYSFTGQFTSGDVTFDFISGEIEDSNGLVNIAAQEVLTVTGVRATRVFPTSLVYGVSALNQRGYFDVLFTPTGDSTLDLSTIMDTGSELRFYGTAARGVTITGTPEHIDDNTFRYSFDGEFSPGVFQLSVADGSVADSSGQTLTGWLEEFELRELTASMFSPADKSNAGRNQINANGFVEVQFADPFGVGIKASTLTDPDVEIELYTLTEEGEEILPPEVTGINGVAEKVRDNIYRFRFSGRFLPGQVYVRFVADSWEDNQGNKGVESEATFNVYSNAASFEIIISGAAELYAAVDSLQLVSVSGEAKISLDIGGPGSSTRLQLDLNGRADVMYFGTIGAVSGRFICDFTDPTNPGIWGVMKMDTNFEKLRPVGVDLDMFALLQINTTPEQKRETLTLPGQAEGGTDLTETYVLSPMMFSLQGAAKFIFHVPDFNDDEEFGLELFRLTGAFSIEISPTRLEVFANAVLQIGPDDMELVGLRATGVFALSFDGFAMDLVISGNAGIDGIMSINGDFRLITNVTGQQEEIRIPQRFIDEGYLEDEFIAGLGYTKDPNDGDARAYIVPAGAPLWGGGNRAPGAYFVMQGSAEAMLVHVFQLEANFRIEVSTSGLFFQADGGLILNGVGSVTARGYLELTRKGLIVAMALDLDVPALSEIGIDFIVSCDLRVNTTDEDRTITPLSDKLMLEPVTILAGDLDIKAEGMLALRIPQTDIEFARISGVFSLDTSAESATIFASGELQIGPRGLDVFNMTVLGVFALVNDGFALDLEVQASGGIPEVAELAGTFRLVSNMMLAPIEVPVPQRFIDGDFLSPRILARLEPSSSNPNRKSYYVPAGAPYLDGTPDDAPSSYIVMMGEGTLTLVDRFDITAGFRIKIKNTGPVIPIDATLDLGPLGWVTVFGQAELRLSGLVAGLSVQMDAPALRDAGLYFDADAEIGVNTGSKEAEIVSETNPDAAPLVIPAKSSFFRFGGEVIVRVPATNLELCRLNGVLLMDITTQGLSIFANAGLTIDAMEGLLEADAIGVFVATADGVAADIDLTFSSKSSVISSFFEFSVSSRLTFNTFGEAIYVGIPDRFVTYLSDRAKSRLVSPAPGLPAQFYAVPAGAPLLEGGYAPAGAYIVFQMQGSMTLLSIFEMSGSFQMVFTQGVFEAKFDAQMKLAPLGQVDASGILSISENGIYGALQLGGKFEVGPVELFGAMQLEVNTTGTSKTIQRVQYNFDNRTVSPTKVPVVLAAKTQRIFIGGLMELPGFTLEGTFEMVNSPSEFRVSVNATFNAFSLLFLRVDGTLAIVKGNHAGVVINLNAVLESGLFGIDSVFNVDASFQLKVNTRSGSGSDQYDYGVMRGYTRVAWYGNISLLGAIDIESSGFIESYYGMFRCEFMGSAEILNQGIYASGYFSNEGEFDIAFGGSIEIGVAGCGVFGSTGFRIARLDSNGKEAFGDGNYRMHVSGYVEGGVKLFGIKLASVRLELNYDGASGRVSITAKVKIIFKEVSKTFTLFYVRVPPPVYLGGNANDTGPTAWNRGILHLNTGRRAAFRNEAEDDINEGYSIIRVGEDPDYPGEIIAINSFGRLQFYRGVTGIVADMGSGHDYIEIGPGIQAPVTIRTGDQKDFIIHNGLGPAIIEGGRGNDEIQGGFGTNRFIFADGIGRDTVTIPDLPGWPFENTFDFSTATENLDGVVEKESMQISPDGYNDRIIGVAQVNGRDLTMLTKDNDTVLGVLENHGLRAGDRVFLTAPHMPQYHREVVVSSATTNTITFDAVNFQRTPPAGIATDKGVVHHDGIETAYIQTTIANWQPGFKLELESSAGGYNGEFVVTQISPGLYSFNVPFDDVRSGVETAVKPREIRLGRAADTLVINGDFEGLLRIDASAGGFDTLQISGSLQPSLRILPGEFQNAGLMVSYTGIERLNLVDPTVALTLSGNGAGQPIIMAGIQLGIVAQSLQLPDLVATPALEINIRDSLDFPGVFETLDLNLRVFGNNSGITITNPISVQQSVQLVAPDGTVSLADHHISSSTVVVKAKKFETPEQRLNLSADTLTIITAANQNNSLQIVNDRDLTLTSASDSTHLVNLDGGIAAIFEGITWVSGIASEWADQIFDGALNPYAVIVDGLLTVDLPVRDESGDEDAVLVIGTLRSRNGDIQITADEMDFLGGPASIRGTKILVLQSASPVLTTRLGTAAETGGGSPWSDEYSQQMLDLAVRDLAALADGFASIAIGRGEAGNQMRLGDAFDITTVKATGESRVINANLKDDVFLYAEHFIVEGDFRAPLDELVLTGKSAEIRKVNLHTPNNSNPDSGLTAASLTLNLQTSLSVGGWLVGTGAVAVSVPAATLDFGIITDVGSSIRQTGTSGSLTISTNHGIRVAGQIATAANSAAPDLAAGTRLDLLAGADIAATGANADLSLEAAEALTLHTGSIVRAGVNVDLTSGAPVTTTTGTGGQITLTTPAEMWLAGLVVSSGGLTLNAGTSATDHADLFNDLTDNDPLHYLADQSHFGFLLTGTILVQGTSESLQIASSDDVILLGNIAVSGPGSDLTVQSDRFVYVAGRATVADTLSILGGVALDGTSMNGADSKGSSIYLAKTGILNTSQAGAEIILHGAQDVDVYLPLVAGGTIGATGVTWAGEGSYVSVTAGQQIMLDAPIQAAAAIMLNPGNAAPDDEGRSLVVTTASGFNAAGLGANGTGSLIRFESPGDIELPANILSGGSIVQTFNASGKLVAEDYTWSGRDSSIEIVAGGRVLIGADTFDSNGNPVKKGTFLRASKSVSISGGTHVSGVGIELYPGGGISSSNPDGSILLDSAQSIDLQGYVASGGQVFLVQNSDGETTGYNVARYGGAASLDITAGNRVRIGQEVYSGKSLNISAGIAQPVAGDEFSDIGLLVMGSGSVRTSGVDGRMQLSSQSGISVLTPSVSATDIYGLYASGTGSTITLLVPDGASNTSGIYVGNRVLAESAFIMNSESNDFTADTFELDLAGSIEVVSESISLSGVHDMEVKGDLISHHGSVTVEALGDLSIRNDVRAGSHVTLNAVGGDLTLQDVSHIDAAGTITLTASGTVLLDGPIGLNTAPENLIVSAQDGLIQATAETSQLRSASSIALTAPVIHFDGLLTTTGSTASTTDYEVQLNAANDLRLTGRFTTAGSVLINSPNSPQIYNFTASQSGGNSRWKIATNSDLSLGRIVSTGFGGQVSEGVRIQAVSELLLDAATGVVTIPAGTQLAVSGDNSELRVIGRNVEVVGSLLGGASFTGNGETTWTGRSATVSINAAQLAIGGTGPDSNGSMVTRGGLLQATGALRLTAAESSASEILINGLSSLRTMPDAASSLAVVTPTPEIQLTSAGTVRVYGVVDAAGTGADLTVNASGTILLDGLLRTSDQLLVNSTSTAADSITLSQLFLKSNAQGILLDASDRMIDFNGYLINADGAWVDENGELLAEDELPIRGGAPVRLSGGSLNAAGTVWLTSAGGMLLGGQIGELSVVAEELVSGTGSVQVRAAGDTEISGRIQAQSTIDVRSNASMTLKNSGIAIADALTHIMGGTLEVSGYISSTTQVILSSVQDQLITGTAQSGGSLKVQAGIGSTWTDSQIFTSIPTAGQLSGGSVAVRGSGVLDAVNEIRVVTGGSFTLTADAVVSPNLTSIRIPVLVQREQTIDVVVGTRQVASGTKLVDQVNYVPTQVSEQVGTQTIRVGTAYHTMDVTLTQDAYYNGSTLREYFIEQVDYQNVARDWCTAPVIPWADYHVWPDGTVRNIVQSPADGGQPVPAPESTLTFAQLTDDQRSVVLSVLGYKRLFNFSYTNARRHQTVSGNTSIISWTPDWAADASVIVNFAAPGLRDKYIRLPEGAREDFLRVVSQGFGSGEETVGQYRDRADVRYTQITSALVDVSPNTEDIDNTIIGWRVAAIEDATNPMGLRDAARQYQIRDDRFNSIVLPAHPSIPIWYGAPADQVGTDTEGQRATAPNGYLADSADLIEKAVFQQRPRILAGYRRFPRMYDDTIDYVDTIFRLFSFSNSEASRNLVHQLYFAPRFERASNAYIAYLQDVTETSQMDPYKSWYRDGLPQAPDSTYELLYKQAAQMQLTAMGYSPNDASYEFFSPKYVKLWALENPIPGMLSGRIYGRAIVTVHSTKTAL